MGGWVPWRLRWSGGAAPHGGEAVVTTMVAERCRVVEGRFETHLKCAFPALLAEGPGHHTRMTLRIFSPDDGARACFFLLFARLLLLHYFCCSRARARVLVYLLFV